MVGIQGGGVVPMLTRVVGEKRRGQGGVNADGLVVVVGEVVILIDRKSVHLLLSSSGIILKIFSKYGQVLMHPTWHTCLTHARV